MKTARFTLRAVAEFNLDYNDTLTTEEMMEETLREWVESPERLLEQASSVQIEGAICAEDGKVLDDRWSGGFEVTDAPPPAQS
jgi:hypothetical protein